LLFAQVLQLRKVVQFDILINAIDHSQAKKINSVLPSVPINIWSVFSSCDSLSGKRSEEHGMVAPRAVQINLSDAERSELSSRLRRRKVSRADAMRAEIVLLAAEGATNLAIAERLGITRVTVTTWRKRFARQRLGGLLDEPRPGAPRTISDEKIAEVVTATLEMLPTGRTHWSSRGMAKASGLAPSTVQRIWKAFSLQPHRVETFKLSTDPLFVEKVRDIVGLYLSPPERALVLCVDEKRRSRRLTAPNRCCRCGPGRPNGEPTTTNGTARHHCSPRSTSRPAT
jgi:transposase